MHTRTVFRSDLDFLFLMYVSGSILLFHLVEHLSHIMIPQFLQCFGRRRKVKEVSHNMHIDVDWMGKRIGGELA